ncbi:MAG TPA: ATP-binding cassette domain-containing protein, partial [Bacillota bacterium]|nr:ATP-binding cassette domain-containing protein [Bacillota bacterium]
MLKVDNLQVYYGGIHALRGVSIEVNKGEIVSIIGSNGAGKSTLLNSISGFLKYKEGEISYNGNKLGNNPSKIVKMGICQVP